MVFSLLISHKVGKSNRGGIWGYKFDILPKLIQTKSTDTSYTLLQYIMDWIMIFIVSSFNTFRIIIRLFSQMSSNLTN